MTLTELRQRVLGVFESAGIPENRELTSGEIRNVAGELLANFYIAQWSARDAVLQDRARRSSSPSVEKEAN